MHNEKEITYGMSVEDVLEGLPPFEPIAYYDKHLDAIRVQTLDCSIWEQRLDRIMTVYRANYHLNPNGIDDIVGFSIKGVRFLLKELGINENDGPIRLAKLLDAIAKLYPSQSTRIAIDYYTSNFCRGQDQEITISPHDEFERIAA